MEGQLALDQACARLERDPDFRVFLEEIEKRREDAIAYAADLDGTVYAIEAY